MVNHSRQTVLLIVAALWAIVVVAGLERLWAYSSRPGPMGKPAALWPAQSSLVLSSDRPTLAMFLHPMCPCSTASVAELSRILARCGGKANVQVVIVPPTDDQDWKSSGLIKSALALPQVRVIIDAGGVEARRFAAKTSGQTMLFSPAGELLFSGGITSSRGHEGDNAGSDAIVSLLTTGGSRGDVIRTSVYGCELLDDTDDSNSPTTRTALRIR